MSDDPEVKWALDLVTYDPRFKSSILRRNQISVPWAILFGAIIPVKNLLNQVPVSTGWVFVLPMTCLGAGIGYGLTQWKRDYERRLDYQMKEYILAHPEHFRRRAVKWAEVFEPWAPIR